jgi:hypothetical protein
VAFAVIGFGLVNAPCDKVVVIFLLLRFRAPLPQHKVPARKD